MLATPASPMEKSTRPRLPSQSPPSPAPSLRRGGRMSAACCVGVARRVAMLCAVAATVVGLTYLTLLFVYPICSQPYSKKQRRRFEAQLASELNPGGGVTAPQGVQPREERRLAYLCDAAARARAFQRRRSGQPFRASAHNPQQNMNNIAAVATAPSRTHSLTRLSSLAAGNLPIPGRNLAAPQAPERLHRRGCPPRNLQGCRREGELRRVPPAGDSVRGGGRRGRRDASP